MVDFLTRNHLEIEGGYPYDCLWVDDTLVVAGLDHDNATTISVYERDQLLSWYKRAELYRQEHQIRVPKKYSSIPLRVAESLFETE
jgi:hypothetical protein